MSTVLFHQAALVKQNTFEKALKIIYFTLNFIRIVVENKY